MDFVARFSVLALTCTVILISASPLWAVSWDITGRSLENSQLTAVPSGTSEPVPMAGLGAVLPPLEKLVAPAEDLRLKLAFGRTVGTSTSLDYATLEVSRPVVSLPSSISIGSGKGELHMALLGSYVFYYEGTIERVKKLNFQDGYEVGWLPKCRFEWTRGFLGFKPYTEGGAGLGYVSETYRNSGSRWNWSLLGALGFEASLSGRGVLAFGVQWRHLSNGNMWGKGDELHNSNSGTDMIQGMATFVQHF